ncbi:unnamed protein product [Medioppia subpectinata]|uniref:TEP1-F n=1 Tax=Medioppia subpectinata TaxID=1979941 RepID=A0A7R9KPQ7_9ACAR|nr:unnamed protein product [Medioppia subpectinata]CAG2106123.1 unnamed protein product [Medioppia subpectinata]
MYVVVAPNVLRPNTDYHISVSLYDIPAPIEVNATVIGPAHSVSTGAVAVGTPESKVLTLAIGDWPEGNYTVRVEGKGVNFTKYDETVAITRDGFLNELSLKYVAKSVSIFIQTDKATYKPGQKVQFRAVVVNPSLVPKDNVSIDIHIENGNGKRIIEWTKLYAKNGVISQELQLSAQPVLGHWTIGVTAFRHNTTKTFTVVADEDVLPTFDVEVVLPSYVTTHLSSEVVATVKAIDTNGKAVKGDLTYSVQAKDLEYIQRIGTYRIKTTIDGSATLTVNLIEDLALDEAIKDLTPHNKHLVHNGIEFKFTAQVRETLTGKQYNKTHTMKIYDRDAKVELIKTYNTYKRGMKNTFVVKVVTQDNKPVADSGPQLKLKYGYSLNESEWKVLMLSPINGLIKFDVFTPRDIDQMVIKAEYMGHTYDLEVPAKAMTSAGHYLQVIRADTTADIAVIGQDVKFVANATEPIVRLVCEVMGRRDIAWAKSFDIPTNITGGYEFSVATVPQMAPSARLLCHYVRPDNREVVADAIDFVFSAPTFTAVAAETRQTFVDISAEDVLNELKAYDTTTPKPVYDSRYGESSATGDTFDESGVGVMHNGYIFFGWRELLANWIKKRTSNATLL